MRLASVVSLWNTVTNKQDPEIRAELYMDGPNARLAQS
jgi:hypothetical protein